MHKNEAKLERDRKKKAKKYKENKHRLNVEQLGTNSLGKHLRLVVPLSYLGVGIPFTEFIQETKVIQKQLSRNKGGKGKYEVKWIDYDYKPTSLEYDKPKPTGTQITHNYASFDDYYKNAKEYHLTVDSGRCKECGSNDQYKTDNDVCCAWCGLVLESNPKLMGFTSKDVYDSQVLNMTTQEVAWDKYWKGE